MNRYFLYQDEDSNSNKYWEIQALENKLIINFGRVGSVGTTKEKDFSTESSCETDSLKSVTDKIKKGYIEIDKSLRIVELENSSPNEKISNYLKTLFNSYDCKLATMSNMHSLFKELYKDLRQYDFEAYKQKAALEIEQNITEWWTNPLQGINANQVLDSILLEYDNCFTGASACAYGIIDWQDFKFHTKSLKMGYDYAFAGTFESMPGITLDYFFNFDKLDSPNLPDDIDEDDLYDMEGYQEILKVYFFAGLVAINEVFNDLGKKNCFDKIKSRKGFMFIIGEHGSSEVFPIYTI